MCLDTIRARSHRGRRSLFLLLAAIALTAPIGVRAPCATIVLDFGPGWPPSEGAACQPSESDERHAKSLYELGRQAHHAGNFAAAFRFYRDAYTFDCTAHILVSNMSKVLEADGQYAAALDLLRLYASRRKPNGDELQTLNHRLENLAEKIAIEPSASSAPSTSAHPRTATLTPPLSPRVDPLPAPPSTTTELPPPRRAKWPGWITMGVGAAVMVAGGVVAGVGQARSDKIERLRGELFDRVGCSSDGCNGERQRADTTLAEATSLRTAGLVALGIGGAAALGGLYWYVSTSRSPNPVLSGRSQFRLTPGPLGMDLTVTF